MIWLSSWARVDRAGETGYCASTLGSVSQRNRTGLFHCCCTEIYHTIENSHFVATASDVGNALFIVTRLFCFHHTVTLFWEVSYNVYVLTCTWIYIIFLPFKCASLLSYGLRVPKLWVKFLWDAAFLQLCQLLCHFRTSKLRCAHWSILPTF